MRVPYKSSSTQITLFFQNLNEYFHSGIYCDLTFTVGNVTFPCHRVILASSSPYFQALLTHQFKENHLERIDLPDVNSGIFSLLLHYIYSGQIELDEENVHDLLIASDMFQMEEVMEFCCHYLSVRLTEDNVLETWKIADELECQSLKKDAEHFILSHFRDLIERDQIPNFPRDLLMKMISNDDLIVDQEQQVLQAILIWFVHNREQSSFEPLIDHVRFEYISKEHQTNLLEQLAQVYPIQ